MSVHSIYNNHLILICKFESRINLAQNNCSTMQQANSHNNNNLPQKFSIRKNKQVMRISKILASKDPKYFPLLQNSTAKQLDMKELNNNQRFIFNQDKSQVSYDCGCLSIQNFTKSQIYISPSQVISRRLLQQGREFMR